MSEDALAPVLKQLSISRYDNDAWGELYRQLWPIIVATLSRRNGLPAVSADDLAQDVMIRLLKSAKFAGISTSQFRAYVNATCRSVAVDYQRKQARRGEEVPFKESLIEWSFRRDGENLVQLGHGLVPGDFSNAEKRLFDHILAGRRATEIAADMNAPVGTVYVWLHRLRRRLRKALGDVRS